MAKAPDPRAVAAVIAEDEAREKAREIRKAREAIVFWLFVDGKRRTIRLLDTSAQQAAALRSKGWSVNDVFFRILDGELDLFAAAWWLGGMQAGVDGTFEDAMAIEYDQAPYVHMPTDEDLSSDEDGDDSPPV